MAFCRNQQQPLSTRPFGGITAILPEAGAWKKAALTSYRATSLSCWPDESVRDETNDRLSLEHLIGRVDWLTSSRIRIDLRGHESRPHNGGSPSTVLVLSSHFAHTSLSPLSGFGQRDDCASARTLDVVPFPLPFMLHFGWVELDSGLGTEGPLLVLHRDKDWLQPTRIPVVVSQRYSRDAPHGAVTCSGS